MSGADSYGTGRPSPWHEYVSAEAGSRDAYLAIVARAHAEYLVGPWPDRAAYETVERQAWLSYYQAGRTAWLRYRAAIDPRPIPPPMPPQYGAANLPIYDSVASNGPTSPRPSYTEHDGGTQ